MAEASGKSKSEIEILLARRAPTHEKLVRAALGAPGNLHASGGAAAVAAPDTG